MVSRDLINEAGKLLAESGARRCPGRWSTTRCATVRSLPTPEQIEVAEGLARLAEIDLATTEKLAPDPEIAH
jgi:hypothetical protein